MSHLLEFAGLNLLRELFESATEVCFVPQKQSLQNRCLVAGSAAGVRRALLASGAREALAAASAELLESHGALDLRPHGMASKRWGRS